VLQRRSSHLRRGRHEKRGCSCRAVSYRQIAIRNNMYASRSHSLGVNLQAAISVVGACGVFRVCSALERRARFGHPVASTSERPPVSSGGRKYPVSTPDTRAVSTPETRAVSTPDTRAIGHYPGCTDRQYTLERLEPVPLGSRGPPSGAKRTQAGAEARTPCGTNTSAPAHIAGEVLSMFNRRVNSATRDGA
jgi:hypothetical protein